MDGDNAAILDGGNLNDVEVLKELVRKSVVPALHYVNTKIFGECNKQVQRMEAASASAQSTCKATASTRQMSTASSRATVSLAFLASLGCIDDQYNAFADYKKAMVMAQYNSRGC